MNFIAEFDENTPVVLEDEDNELGNRSTSLESTASTTQQVADAVSNEERELEAELASWQEKVGPDFKLIEASLSPVEKYALRFHTDIEPFVSIFFLSEQQRLEGLELTAQSEEWDVEKIEKEKEEVK